MLSSSADAPRSADEIAVTAALGRSLREARIARKLPMRAVAAEAGISQPFLSQIENGRTMPALLTLYRLARALGVSAAELIPGELDRPAIHLVRRAEGRTVPVSEAPNAAVGRVISAGRERSTVVSEYRVTSDQDLGKRFESDGEILVYIVDGAVRVSIEAQGDWVLEPGDSLSYPGALRNHWSLVGESATIVMVYEGGTRNTAET